MPVRFYKRLELAVATEVAPVVITAPPRAPIGRCPLKMPLELRNANVEYVRLGRIKPVPRRETELAIETYGFCAEPIALVGARAVKRLHDVEDSPFETALLRSIALHMMIPGMILRHCRGRYHRSRCG